MSLLLGWAASATAFLKPYAPFSWVLSGMLGIMLCCIIYAIFACARVWHISSNINKEFYKESHKINPMDIIFRDQRINILDLVSPIEPVVRGKTFIDCELIGPANIALNATAPGKGGINGVSFFACNACRVKNHAFMTNALMFEDCTLLRGKIFRVTLFIPESGYEHIKNSMPGMEWISV